MNHLIRLGSQFPNLRYDTAVMKISRKSWIQIISTTVIRTVFNTGFRMVFPLQPILMKGFGINLTQITRMYAGQSLVGIFSPILAAIADTRGRKTGMLVGMILFSLGTLVVVFLPNPLGFFLFLVLSLMGKAIFDPSMQAYFGDTIPYERRGFVLGITEISWSLGFFLGVPAVGFLMNQFGLLSPFKVLSVLGVVLILIAIYTFPPDSKPESTPPSIFTNFGLVLRSISALGVLGVMLGISFSNQLVNAVFGVWLNESFALQIAALSGASAVIGIAELVGEGGVSLIADRISPKRAVLIGLIGSVISAAVLPFLGDTVWGAFIGLFFYYLTFEFTIVSNLPLMTQVFPEARATLMALSIASISLGRGLGSLIAAPLYENGFVIIAFVAAIGNLLAIFSLRPVVIKEDQ